VAKVKQDLETSVKTNGKVIGKGRQVVVILRLVEQGQSLEELQLTENEIKQLIDYATEIEEMRREIAQSVKNFVDPIKKLLVEHAKENNWKHKDGNLGKCDIAASSTTITGTATELIQILKKEGKTKLFDSLVSIRVTDSKKFLGEDILFKSGFFKMDRKEFGTVSLKPRT
jgi:hypothetical protein